MQEYDLSQILRQLGRAAGAGDRILGEIEPTRFHEEELRRIHQRAVAFWSRSRQAILDAYRPGGNPSVLQNVIVGLREDARINLPELNNLIEDWVADLGRWHTNRFRAVVQSAVTVDVAPLLTAQAIQPGLSAAVARNVGLIQSISVDTGTRIERAVFDAFQNGQGKGQLQVLLREQLGFSSRRAKLVARDQLATLSGNLTRLRHVEAGLKEYEWSTVGDSRVRRHHRERNNQRFEWDNPPSGGHPGSEVQCRCRARGVIPVL